MGNSYQTLSDAVTLVASDKTWIESESIRQLHFAASLDGMQNVAGMPDLHPGITYPVGAAFFSFKRIYPALIGGDIGCGMAFARTSLDGVRPQAEPMDRKLGDLDQPPERFSDMPFDIPGWALSEPTLGTIGGGNHFAEFQKVDAIYDEAAAEQLEVDKRHLFLLVHTGSRGMGHAVYERHVQAFSHAGLDEDCPAFADYLFEHDRAVAFAQFNRAVVIERILQRLKARGTPVLDVTHNAIARETVDGMSGWMHRKGANSSHCAYSIVPGSRGDFTYLVQPVADARSLFSIAHGAGRKWARKECRGRLEKRFTLKQMARSKIGSHVICNDTRLVFEEAPEAYKPVESVIADMACAGVIRLVARFRPVLTYKTRRK